MFAPDIKKKHFSNHADNNKQLLLHHIASNNHSRGTNVRGFCHIIME